MQPLSCNRFRNIKEVIWHVIFRVVVCWLAIYLYRYLNRRRNIFLFPVRFKSADSSHWVADRQQVKLRWNTLESMQPHRQACEQLYEISLISFWGNNSSTQVIYPSNCAVSFCLSGVKSFLIAKNSLSNKWNNLSIAVVLKLGVGTPSGVPKLFCGVPRW